MTTHHQSFTSEAASEMPSVDKSATSATGLSVTVTADDFHDTASQIDHDIKEMKGSFDQRAEALRKVLEGTSKLELGSHERTRNMLQAAYATCLYALEDEQGMKEFAAARLKRNVPNAKDGENEFLPLIKVIWGSFSSNKKGDKTIEIWKHNRSTEKYASVFRHLHENDVPSDGAAEFIDNFHDNEHGKKINGIIAADRATNGKKRAPVEKKFTTLTSNDLEEITKGKEIQSLASVEKPEGIKAEYGPIILMARVIDGKIHILGDLALDKNVVKGAIESLVKRSNKKEQPKPNGAVEKSTTVQRTNGGAEAGFNTFHDVDSIETQAA